MTAVVAVVERRPLGLDPLLSVTLSRLDLRELHAAMDWPNECIARREYKRMSNQIVSLLAIRRRQEDQPLIRYVVVTRLSST